MKSPTFAVLVIAAAGLADAGCESCEFSGIGANVELVVEDAPEGTTAEVCVERCYDECTMICEEMFGDGFGGEGLDLTFTGFVGADSTPFTCPMPYFELRATAPGCEAKTRVFNDTESGADAPTYTATFDLDCEG